ncbi:MAG: smalltalk protein [Bacteroides sp.]|nr:smalltalk protein [Bacteroides sp.]
MSKKKTWDIILKAIIAVASAILGALGAQAMTLM